MSRRSRRNRKKNVNRNRNQRSIANRIQQPLAKTETTTLRQFSGPIPPPETLKQYDEIKPGMAERVFELTEKQVDHRIQLEGKALEYKNNQVSRAQWLSFIIAGSVVISGVIVATAASEPQWGSLLSGSGLGSVLLSVMLRRKVEENNQE